MKLESLRHAWLTLLFAVLLVGCGGGGGGGGGETSPAPSATATCTWDSSSWDSGCTWG